MPQQSQQEDAEKRPRFWIQSDSPPVQYYGLTVRKAHPEHESDVMDDDVRAFGRGIAFYRGDAYLGYHVLPPQVARMRLERIVETQEFLNIYTHYKRKR